MTCGEKTHALTLYRSSLAFLKQAAWDWNNNQITISQTNKIQGLELILEPTDMKEKKPHDTDMP